MDCPEVMTLPEAPCYKAFSFTAEWASASKPLQQCAQVEQGPADTTRVWVSFQQEEPEKC